MSTHMSVSYCCKSINHKTVIIKITVTDYYNVSVSRSLGDLLPQARSATFLLGLWAGCLLYAPVEKLMAQDTNKGTRWTGLRHDPVGLMLRIGSQPSASVQWLKQITWCWETDSTSLVRGTTESRDSGMDAETHQELRARMPSTAPAGGKNSFSCRSPRQGSKKA